MVQMINYTEADFARIASGEFATLCFNLTQELIQKKINRYQYENQIKLWIIGTFGLGDTAHKFIEFALPAGFFKTTAWEQFPFEKRKADVTREIENLAKEANISVEDCWIKMIMLEPSLKQYAPKIKR